jgi:hypothetical protein
MTREERECVVSRHRLFAFVAIESTIFSKAEKEYWISRALGARATFAIVCKW